jgi:hypothetical protein
MSETAPTWLDEFVRRIPDAALRTDFLRYWGKLKKHNENDELLILVNFMGVLTAIMSTLPQEAHWRHGLWENGEHHDADFIRPLYSCAELGRDGPR